jgi:hypothetical protein
VNRQQRRRTLQRRAATDPHGAVVPPGYTHVDKLSEKDLHSRLVSDAVAGVPTPLAWAVAAYTRVGQLNGRGPEAAYQAVREEAAALTGGYSMPM